MICLICNEEIFTGDEIKCNSCYEYLHFACAGFRESVFKKISKSSENTWACCSCKANNKVTVKLSSQNVGEGNSSSFSNDTIEALVKSVDFMSEQFDSFKNQIKEIFCSLKQIQLENKSIKDQNIKLTEELLHLNKKINTLEQKSIENNIELVCVPETANESCTDIVIQIASNIELSVLNAYRVFSGKNKNPRKIVAIINSNETRNKILTQGRKIKIKANQLNQNWENKNIFINEQMTQMNRNLFFKAKNIAREIGFKYIWFKNTKIFAKKSETSNVFIIYDDKSLSKIA